MNEKIELVEITFIAQTKNEADAMENLIKHLIKIREIKN